ncbi:sperm-associated antigen 1-like [Ptychodera flava]|uniref:sperm-associated antigen 1-like n=1 Tax=Ptychodera flava TaxID=63121 RepID=UPI00396A41D7
MAENLLGGGVGKKSSVAVEHLDYNYIRECTDIKELGKILRVLNSGEEGHYPDLIQFCEKRIEEIAGPESKYLRKDKPPSSARDFETEEWTEIDSNFKAWTDEMNAKDIFLKKEKNEKGEDNLPPIRSGGTINTDTGQVTFKEEKPFYQPSADRIKSADYRKWDKFDVDKEIEKIDKEETPNSSNRTTNTADKTSLDIEHTVDSTGLTEQEKELKANREKDKGNEAFHAKEYSEAEAYYSRSISLIKSAAAYNNRALARIRQEKFKEALSDCNVVLDMEPDNVKGYMRRGVAKKGLKDFVSSKRDFQHVLSLEPQNKRAQELLAEIATEELKVKNQSKNESKESGRRMVIQEVEGSDSSDDDSDDDDEDRKDDKDTKEEITNSVPDNNATPSENTDLKNGKEQIDKSNENVQRTSGNNAEGREQEEVIAWTEEDEKALFGDDVGEKEESAKDDDGEDSDVVMEDLTDTQNVSDESKVNVDFGSQERDENAVNSETAAQAVKQDETDGASKSKISHSKQKDLPKADVAQKQPQEAEVPSQPPKATAPSQPLEATAPSTPAVVEARSPSPPPPPPPLPESVVILKNRGNELYKAGQYGEAIEKYSKAIDKLKPEKQQHAANLGVLFSNRAACYSKTGDCRSCITDSTTALELAPFSSKPLQRRAQAYETLEKYKEAYVDYQAVFSMDPSATLAQAGSSRMANILKEMYGPTWREKLPKTAVRPSVVTAPPIITTTAQGNSGAKTTTTKATESAVRTSSSSSEVPPKETMKPVENLSKAEQFKQLKDEGNEKVKKGQFQEAVNKYTACIGVDPEQVVSYTNRALCFLRLDEPRKAESDCNKALEMEAENIKALFRRAQARKMLEQYKASLQDLTTLIKIDPKNGPAKKEMELVKEYWRKELREAQQKQNEKKESEKKTEDSKTTKKASDKKQTQQKTRNRISIEEVESSGSDEEDEPEPKSKAKKQSPKSKSKPKEPESKKAEVQPATTKAEKKSKELKSDSPRTTAAESSKGKHNVKVNEKGEMKRTEMDSTGDYAKQDSKVTDSKKQSSKITEVEDKQTKKNELPEQQGTGSKSKSKKKGKQKGTVETPVVQNTAEPVLNKATPYEFMQAWMSIKGKDTAVYAKLLRQVKPDELPKVLSNKLEGDMLTKIVKSIAEHFVDKGEEDLGYQYLTNLCKAERFQVVAMFLTDREKRSVKSVISKLTAHSSSMYTDKNLAELMSNYGVAR